MAKWLGYKANCGHFLQVDISDETCVAFGVFHGQRIPAEKPDSTIIGIAERCPDCFPEEDDEKVIYYRKDNSTIIRPLECHEKSILKLREVKNETVL